MGIFNFYDAAKRAIQDVVSPDLQFLKGQLQALSVEIRRLDEKIDSKHAEVLSEIRQLDGRIEALERQLDGRIDSLDRELKTAIDIS
jgi:prefoldin subunit 5